MQIIPPPNKYCDHKTCVSVDQDIDQVLFQKLMPLFLQYEYIYGLSGFTGSVSLEQLVLSVKVSESFCTATLVELATTCAVMAAFSAGLQPS